MPSRWKHKIDRYLVGAFNTMIRIRAACAPNTAAHAFLAIRFDSVGNRRAASRSPKGFRSTDSPRRRFASASTTFDVSERR